MIRRPKRRSVRGRLGGLVLASWAFFAGPVAAEKLAVHLPSHRAESAGRLAAAIDLLAADLGTRLGIELEPELFRRVSDLEAFLDGNEPALLLCDASFLAPGAHGFEPVASFVQGGASEHSRVVAVPSESTARRLADLRGEELTVAQTVAQSDYLGSRIFAGELDPGAYFSAVREVIEDSEAVAEVLFGQSKAALVAEHTPLLQANLGSKLRIVYRSRPLLLPVLAVRRGGPLSATALGAALDAGGPAPWLAGLGIDGLRRLAPDALEPAAGERSVLWVVDVPSLVGSPARPSLADLPLPYYLPLPEPRSVAEDILSTGEPDSR